MKKIFAILALAISGTAFAADYVSVAVDNVQGLKGGQDSTAQYVRFGKGFGDYQFNVQSRTAKFKDNTTGQSLEATVANKNVSAFGITPFVGTGHDITGYNYGLVGATAGAQVGPGYLLGGAKQRVGSTETAMTHQRVLFASYSVPVAKNVSVDLNGSKSYQTIKEAAWGLGVTFGF